MAKYKSPGQKRKSAVRVVSILVFLLSTYLGSVLLGWLKSDALAWVEDHGEATAVITSLDHEVEEYRNRKGRERERDVYSLTYEYSVDGEVHSGSAEVPYSVYSGSEVGGKIEVLFDLNDPAYHGLKSELERDIANNTTTANMIAAVPYSGPAVLFLHWILTLIFVRESKKALPIGFYTETSWLDIDDKYIVALDGDHLIYFNINEKRVPAAQNAFQEGATLDELVAQSKPSKVSRICLSEVTALSSDHNSDVIAIVHKGETHQVEFLNQAVKAHALERIKRSIPETMSYARRERTRLQAALPTALMLFALIGIAFFADVVLLTIFVGFVTLFWGLPRLFSRLLDPTVTERWVTDGAERDLEEAAV